MGGRNNTSRVPKVRENMAPAGNRKVSVQGTERLVRQEAREEHVEMCKAQPQALRDTLELCFLS